MADFQNHQVELAALGVKTVALSPDSRDQAATMARQLELEFPIAYGLDPEAVSRAIGCYTGTREGHRHLQPTAFVLAPDGTILHAVYSSGKVGRLSADDALTIIRDRVKASQEVAR